jgi:PPOX class probable F420-dependent enzyme
MPSRRDAIKMTDAEIDAYLNEGAKTLNVATFNHDGSIHLVAMWFAMNGSSPVFWTYNKSQKILNLQRDPRISGLVETGEKYEELKGVELVGRGEVITDRDEIMRLGSLIAQRYFGDRGDAARPFVERTGAKRYVVRMQVDRVVSWDHTKLGGVY